MGLSNKRRAELEKLCSKFRQDLIKTLHDKQTGHPGGSLSVCEILTLLYFEKAKVDPNNDKDPNRDKIVLCKGHGAPMLYIALAEKGFFPAEEMGTFRQISSRLQGHPCSLYTKGVDMSTGPLGVGYPAALGISLADRLDNRAAYTYAILGDGEINEGVVWETCMNAVKQKADHLITILDWNKVQLDGTTEEIMPMGDIEAKFKAFGYNTISLQDGHDLDKLSEAIDSAKAHKNQPTIILAHTIKGKGISFMEGKNTWHGAAINDQQFAQAMEELGGGQNV